jgi:hypothetical protein
VEVPTIQKVIVEKEVPVETIKVVEVPKIVENVVIKKEI